MGRGKDAKGRRGDSELHLVLRGPYTAQEVQMLLDAAGSDEERRRMVNSKTLEGDTALMLAIQAAICRGAVSKATVMEVADILLENGAEESILAHSTRRVTAGDRATTHGLRRLGQKLKLMEAAQMSANHEGVRHSDAGMCGDWKRPLCSICGDRLTAVSKIRTAEKSVEMGQEANSLVARFFQEPGVISRQGLDSLSGSALHSVNRRKNFTKEFTESLGMLFGLRKVLQEIESQAGGEVAANGWHIVDLCCGKGMTAAIVGASFPDSIITAVDRMPSKFLPHYAESGLSNIRYTNLDVMATTFPEDFGAMVKSYGGDKPIVVLGMHLCGLLSLRAVDLMALHGVLGVVVAPCCMPRGEEADSLELFAGCELNGKFEWWCEYLQTRMRHHLSSPPAGQPTPSGSQGISEGGRSAAPGGPEVDPEVPQHRGSVWTEVIEGFVTAKRTVISCHKGPAGPLMPFEAAVAGCVPSQA